MKFIFLAPALEKFASIIIRIVAIVLLCYLAYICGFVVLSCLSGSISIILIAIELLAPLEVAEFAGLCLDQIEIYIKLFYEGDLLLHSLIMGYGYCYLYAVKKEVID